MKKVGMFPDVFERLALRHLEKGDPVSALVTGEFYASRHHFPGFGRPFVFNAELMVKMGRKLESKDAARIALKSPWWTLGTSYPDVAAMAGWGDEQVAFMRERVTKQGRREDLLKGKSPAQPGLCKAMVDAHGCTRVHWWFPQKSPRSSSFLQKQKNDALSTKGWSTPPVVKGMVVAMIQGCAGSADRRERSSSGSCGDMRKLCIAGQLKAALYILKQQDNPADSSIYALLLRECTKTDNLEMGKQVHSHIIHSGFKPNIFLLNTLVNMYAKCGSVVDARLVFDKMPDRNVFTWTIMMAGYAKHGGGMEAIEIYEQMVQEGVTPDKVTFICVLNACANLAALEKGTEVHAHIIKAGITPDIILENTLVDMYAKCGNMKNAAQVFDNMSKRDVVSWSAMIAGYAEHGSGMEAIEMYEQMIRKGVPPNKVTFICVLNACGSLAALEKGKQVHADIVKARIAPDIILETALAAMYVKCGKMKDAHQVFSNMAQRNVVSWSAMIAGCAQHGFGMEAIEIYEQMIWEGVMPNNVTFICILKACASLAALEKGKEVHAHIIKAGIPPDIILDTTLLDMYAKCGSMKDARAVFNNMAQKNVVSWNAMITGYAQHGCIKEALKLFAQMQQEGVKPDGITFICVLSACSHAGLVDEGCHYFDSMSQDHGLTPTLEHFGCIVALLGRAGRLGEAENFIQKMPITPGAVVWRALLGACRIHGNVKVAEHAAKCLLKWDPQHTATYVLLSNIYAAAGRWDDLAKVRKMMQDRGIRQETWDTFMEPDNQGHTFIVDDILNPLIQDTHAELKRWNTLPA